MPASPLAFFLVFLVVLLVSGLTACSSADKPVTRLQGETMGTTWHVTVVDAGQQHQYQQTRLQTDIERILQEVNAAMSTWLPDSELSRFNQAPTTDWFPVSADVVTVVASAAEVSEMSDGVFDVTVGPLISLWGFGKAEKATAMPDAVALETARARVGYQKLAVRTEPAALRKARSDMYVNLSAIAKGFGVDKLGEYLEAQGIQHYMAEIGGEVRTRGKSQRGDAWRIAIEKPVALGRAIQQGVQLQDAGLATSGDYRNFFTHDGQRYSHTIDPNTGYPVKHSLASVSVLADTTMLADAYATMLMAMGEVRGKTFADQQGIAAYFIWRTDDGFEHYTTNGFKSALITQ